MKSYATVDDFINAHSERKRELNILRNLLLETELEEAIKWGAPVYTINNKNVVGLGAFKTYVGLWFFQGALLKDKNNVLINAQDGKTVAMRQWRFESLDDIDKKLVNSYVLEAIDNQKQGKGIKPVKNKPLIIPGELAEVFDKNKDLKLSFEKFGLSKKREFAEYIATAKQERTKIKRLEKIIPMIENGIGLNDKYR
ncbi:hypothetical protein GTQ40_02245 [Flavobacteriaceae bacterium R38]|nr:hypothetical protein [Flavobacteriaceae bacterium R38]